VHGENNLAGLSVLNLAGLAHGNDRLCQAIQLCASSRVSHRLLSRRRQLRAVDLEDLIVVVIFDLLVDDVAWHRVCKAFDLIVCVSEERRICACTRLGTTLMIRSELREYSKIEFARTTVDISRSNVIWYVLWVAMIACSSAIPSFWRE
jgi:hypothetical protein